MATPNIPSSMIFDNPMANLAPNSPPRKNPTQMSIAISKFT